VVSVKRAPGHFMLNLFLHPVGYTGQAVHFDAFGVRNVDALFFMVGGVGEGGSQCDFHKKQAGTRYTKFVFLHTVISVDYIVHSSA
jgi:hypothetical protein